MVAVVGVVGGDDRVGEGQINSLLCTALRGSQGLLSVTSLDHRDQEGEIKGGRRLLLGGF